MAASLRTALAVLGTGIVLVVVGLVPGIISVHHRTRPVSDGTMPATVSVRLAAGTWEFFTSGSDSTLDPHNIAINGRADTGHTVQVRSTREHGGRTYTGQVAFEVPATATYRLVLGGNPGTRYFIARTYESSIKRAAGWFALAGAGALVAVAGLIMLIAGSSRRRHARQPAGQWGTPWQPLPGQQPPAYPPQAYPAQPQTAQPQPVHVPAYGMPPQPTGPQPGWYPDPAYASTGKRWWDGTGWSDHTQP